MIHIKKIFKKKKKYKDQKSRYSKRWNKTAEKI